MSRLRSLPPALFALILIASCGGGDNTATNRDNTATSPQGAIPPAAALEIAKSSGVAPPRITLHDPAVSKAPQPAPELQRRGAGYLMPSAGATIDSDPRRAIVFQLKSERRSYGTGTVTPLGVSGAAAQPIPIAQSSGLFFANTYRSTDTILTPSNHGLEMALQLRARSAPVSFTWRVVGSDTELAAQPTGEAAGLNYRARGENSFPLQAQALPWNAYDSSSPIPGGPGKKVATHLTASGDEITVAVDHRASDLAYPVVVSIDWDQLLQ